MLTGGYPYFKNSTRLLYWQSQTCWKILVHILLVSIDNATAVIFVQPHLIFVEIPQVLGFSHSVDMG